MHNCGSYQISKKIIPVIQSLNTLENFEFFANQNENISWKLFEKEYFQNLQILSVPYIDNLADSSLVHGLKNLKHLQLSCYKDRIMSAEVLIKILSNKKPGIKVTANLISVEEVAKVIRQTSSFNIYEFYGYHEENPQIQ